MKPRRLPAAVVCVAMIAAQQLSAVKLYADAAPYRSYHYHANPQKNTRGTAARGHHDTPGPQAAIAHLMGKEADRDDEYENDDGESQLKSYFERHNLHPPRPLLPSYPKRSTRRMQQTESSEVDNAEEEKEEVLTELDQIMQDAMDGSDANTRLRQKLLSNYDKHSYPWEYVWYNDTQNPPYKRTGVPVEMNINFHRVFDVDIVNSVMDLVVWFRLTWVDPRLVWDPNEYGGLNKTRVWLGDGGTGGETSEIWAPDVELWNLETGLKGSLEDAYARVSYDGQVWWGRPGHLRPTCKFSGLDSFPFDKLTCAMEFGSWTLAGKFIDMYPVRGVGFSIGNSLTAGESYEEYSFAEVDPVRVVRHVYSYESQPEDDWPVLIYNITVARSWQPYARGYIAVQIILNVIGFSAFWLPPSCGERMSLSVTAMLAALASEIVVAASLPAASEITWFSKFSIMSMSFAFISLLECVLVLYFYYKRSEDMVPKWYILVNKWYKKRGEEAMDSIHQSLHKKADEQDESDTVENAGRTSIKQQSLGDQLKNAAFEDSWNEDASSKSNDYRRRATDPLPRKQKSVQFAQETCPSSEEEDYTNDASFKSAAETEECLDDCSPSDGETNETSRTLKMQKYMFERDQRQSQIFERIEQTLSRPPVARDADDFHDGQELENNLKWKKVAARIDDMARFWIPATFIVALAVILAEAF